MRRVWLVLLAIFGVLMALVIMLVRSRPSAEPEDPQHVIMEIPQDHSYGGAAFGRQLDISPDGKKVVYVGETRNVSQVYVQEIGGTEASVIAGTAGASEPTFSPDGRYVVFYAEGELKKAALVGSEVSVIAKPPPPRGIAWLDADTLILGNTQGALLRIPAPPGEWSLLTQSMGPHLQHLAPSILPGNKAIVFTASRGALANARIGVLALETGEERTLLDENAFAARYVPTGHIVFSSGPERALMAARFDLDTLSIVGTPRRILEMPLSGRGHSTDYSFSATGALIYTPTREDIDDFFREFGNINSAQIHVQLNWFEELKRLVP